MNELELVHDAERAASAWVVGDCDAAAALRSICQSIERSGHTSCAFVRRSPFDIFGSQTPSPATFLDLAIKTAPNRALHTKHDAEWPRFLPADGEETREFTWFACETARRDGADLGATLVVLGRDDALREPILRAIPRLTRLCAAIDERDQRRAQLGTATHRLTNLIAGVLVNVDFASELTSDALRDLRMREPLRDLSTALGHARESAGQLAAQVGAVTRLL